MISIELASGVMAQLVEMKGDRVVLHSRQAAAPGSPLDGVVFGDRRLRIKVRHCARSGEDFTIEGRFYDLTRELRQLIQDRLRAT